MSQPRRAGPSPRACAWWIKCNPTAPRHGGWNWPDLFQDYRPGQAYTWSVGTALSQKNARIARAGDPVFGYAAGEGHRELLALAQVERAAVFVPGQGPVSRHAGMQGGFTVALQPVALLEQPLPLGQVRAVLRGTDPEFFRTRFGSIFKVGPTECARLLAAVKVANPHIRIPRAWPSPAGRVRRSKG